MHDKKTNKKTNKKTKTKRREITRVIQTNNSMVSSGVFGINTALHFHVVANLRGLICIACTDHNNEACFKVKTRWVKWRSNLPQISTSMGQLSVEGGGTSVILSIDSSWLDTNFSVSTPANSCLKREGHDILTRIQTINWEKISFEILVNPMHPSRERLSEGRRTWVVK